MSIVSAPTQKVHLVSLGCPKNRVDSEVMVGQLMDASRYELVDEPDGADVIIVNTCSFIQPATEESIETVLEMAKFKEGGSCSKLVVTGCMVQRYGESLEGELPEVDHFLGTGEYHRIDQVLSALFLKDIATGLVKSFSFAWIITCIGVFRGLQFSGGAAGVGFSTTSSVVTSTFGIIALDCFWGVLFYMR